MGAEDLYLSDSSNGQASNKGGDAPQAGSRQLSTRHRRAQLCAFVADAPSEKALDEGLRDFLPAGVDIRRGGIRAAIAAMEKGTTPGVLIVDVSDEEQPLTALAQLALVVEPDVRVLVIGDIDSVDFYREVTRTLGASDYLSKPLRSDKVAKTIGPLLGKQGNSSLQVDGGSMVIVTGVRGGVGATTLAVNLAGHFGITLHRHTVLLDPDLYLGDAAFQLNVQSGSGLRMALEDPQRIDSLLAERAAQPVADRLHVLSGQEPMVGAIDYAPKGAVRLVATLRRRYNFIVTDLPFRPGPLHDDLLSQVHHRVLVMLPTLASVRSTLRMLEQPEIASLSKHPVIVLNRAGAPQSLSRREIESALNMRVDVVVNDYPRQVAEAAMLGELAMLRTSGFRSSIVELARHVAADELLDAAPTNDPANAPSRMKAPWRFFSRSP